MYYTPRHHAVWVGFKRGLECPDRHLVVVVQHIRHGFFEECLRATFLCSSGAWKWRVGVCCTHTVSVHVKRA